MRTRSLPTPVGLLTALFVSALGVAVPAAGEELRRTEPTLLGIEAGSAALLAAGTQLLPVPSHCVWCEPTAVDRWLHVPAAREGRRGVAFASHVGSMIVLPVGAACTALIPPFSGKEPDRHAFEDFAIISEAVFFDLALTSTIKVLAARRRPAFYYGREGEGEYAASPRQENVSFFSGDTSGAFALASAASTLSFLRGYAVAPYVTAAGSTLAASVAILRVAADVHWPTDVFVGAVVGTAIGVGMPLLLHGRSDSMLSPGAQGSSVAPVGPTPSMSFAGTF